VVYRATLDSTAVADGFSTSDVLLCRADDG
jgi:hypothetical protein